jgi:RimJ/RimL family protein N-acetyltransferase
LADRYWPLFDLRLTTPELELRPLTEADLPLLADILPDDVELDPASAIFPGAADGTARGASVHQAYWKSFGNWNVDAWRLSFAIFADGRLVGVQELEGNDFALLRTVDTSSFLVPDHRGRGLGKQMRSAVLALAFGPMEAQAAITEAWHDNHASLGVSRALGYRPNGEAFQSRAGGADTMVHLRLTRADWLAADHAAQVRIAGFDACRAFFGLGDDAGGPDLS